MDHQVKADQKRKLSVFGKLSNRPGFSLLEILIAVAIVGIFAAVAIPNFGRMMPYYQREQFIAQLNGLVQCAWQQALTTRSVCKVDFNIKNREVALLLQKLGEQDKNGDPVFAPIKTAYLKTTIRIPEQIDIKQFFIEGFDEMTRSSTKNSTNAWFFVVPDGLTQLVTINLVDTKDLFDNKPRQIGLVLNPFHAQFAVYDSFQKG